MKNKSNTRAILSFFWTRTKNYPVNFGLSSLNALQTIANGVLTPLVAGLVIQKIQNPTSVSLSFNTMFGLIAIWSAIGILMHRIAMVNLNKLDIAVMKDIYRIIAQHLMHESYSFHAKNFSGALLNQSTRLAQGYITFMDTLALDGLRSFVIVSVSVVALSFYDPILACILLVMSIIGSSSAIIMAEKRYPLRKKAVTAGTKQTAYLADMITNAITVKAFAAEEHEQAELDTYLEKTAQHMHANWKLGITANNITTTIAVATNVIILLYGIYATRAGIIGLGVFIASQLYAVRITSSFWDLTRIIRTLETVFADAHEMVEILSNQPAINDIPDAKKIAIEKGEIQIEDVTFRYDDADKTDNVFENLNLTIPAGQKVGLVGLSGGGKTTITKLLLRFMDIQSGSIKIDGQDISQVTQTSLREQIAYVPQEPLLFHRSLIDNIRYSKLGASDDDVINAARLAHAHEFISALPDGYKTQVGERGVKLSGGQRQRIAIARAILKDSPLFVLDEATSALDSESEQLIQDALVRVMEGRTSIVVAHRLSTIQALDRIIVINDGAITEQGTHKELLSKNGVYAKLWKHQSGGFLDDDPNESSSQE